MNQNPKIIRHINNKKIEVEEIYSTQPKRVDELREHIGHLLKMAKEFENNFKKEGSMLTVLCTVSYVLPLLYIFSHTHVYLLFFWFMLTVYKYMSITFLAV